MNKRPDPELVDDENPEWTEEDFRTAKRFSEMPTSFQEKIRRARGPQKHPTKVQTTIRFDRDVLEDLRATGSGWQTRVNDVMREWLRQQRS